MINIILMKKEQQIEDQLLDQFEFEELEERLEMTSSGWYYYSFYYSFWWYL